MGGEDECLFLYVPGVRVEEEGEDKPIPFLLLLFLGSPKNLPS